MAQPQNKETTPLLPNQASVTDQLRSMCASWCSCTMSMSLTRRCRGQHGRGVWFLKSKAVVLVLFWNMVVLLTFQPALEPDIIVSFLRMHPPFIAPLRPVFSLALMIYGLAAFLLLFFPLGGFVADVCFGRFKTLQCSLWNLWISAIFAICGVVSGIIVVTVLPVTGLDVIPAGLPLPWLLGIIIACTYGTVCVSLIVSYVLFNANVIQFGLDQLQDNPASDSSLFVYWFEWTYHLALCLYKFSANLISCPPPPKHFNDSYELQQIPYYSLLIVLAIVLLLGYIALPITLCLIRHRRFRRWFIIEPGAHNPYKLVYRVLKFAVKHDHPIQRSAFTYCEDELPSRLDLGKSKYGGPFTTEEVENVKSFGGIIRVLLTLGPIFMVELAASDSLSDFYFHLDLKVIKESWVNPVYNETFYSSSLGLSSVASCVFFFNTRAVTSAIIVIVIPLYIMIIRPFFRCNFFCMPKRLGVAIVLFTLSLLVSLTIDIVGHIEDNKANCMFWDKYIYDFDRYNYVGSRYNISQSSSFINSNVVVIQVILNAFAIVLFYTSAFEFICAQSPHSMKGLIIGIFFAVYGVFKFIGFAVIYIPFYSIHRGNKHPSDWLSCGFAYYVTNILIAIIALVAYTLVASGYQYRQRDEPSNVRRFVENYYENLQDEPGYDYDDTDEHEVFSLRPQ